MSTLSDYSGIVLDLAYSSPQTFTLPEDYARGSTIPPLTGFQANLIVDPGQSATATLTWSIQRLGTTVTTLASGTTTGTARDGATWFSVYFPAVAIEPSALADTYQLTIASSGGASAPTRVRILAAVADGGTDFLGNIYRSIAIPATADEVLSLTTPGDFGYWRSQPYPSPFGVASLYLDVSQLGASVIDRFTLDPLTPGVYFHVYYSNDLAGPGTDPESWEKLLWRPIYETFRATRRQTFALPGPISAKYVKVEFSGLQASRYDAGRAQRPSTYKKYPKWVLDYFIAQFGALELDLLSSGVNITYDALDLAYNYYTADIISEPTLPAPATSPTPAPNAFLNASSALDLVDPVSLSKIDLGLSPFSGQPALLSNPTSILGAYARSVASPNYPVENPSLIRGDTSVVSNTAREPLLIERALPSMFFYLPCRHGYRLAQASFTKNIAYFAGVKSLVLHRDVYTGPKDQPQYNEILGDGTNLAFNDFEATDSLTPLQPLSLVPAIVLS